jgi:hypothetical protein
LTYGNKKLTVHSRAENREQIRLMALRPRP